MRSKILIRCSILAAICVAVLYALRVWRVGAGFPVSTRVLTGASVAVALGTLGLAASLRRRVRATSVILVTSGSLLMVCAVVCEYTLGVASVASLEPDETAVLGRVRATFSGFEACYSGEGDLLGIRSDLIVDFGSGDRNLTVVSGDPSITEGYQIYQLGFDIEQDQDGEGIRTDLGFLKQEAGGPFVAGFTVLGIGVLTLLMPSRRSRKD